MTERALILKEPWATLVVKGKKTIEIRTRPTTKIGQEIYIAKAGTKTLIGKVTITDCRLLTSEEFQSLAPQHHALNYSFPPNKNIYGWYLKNAYHFPQPVPYNHPQGAQIWVKIPNQ